MQLGLTKEQIAKRTQSIGGSDANTLMSGDDERILNLWREKIGEKEPDDLSGILPVQMGSFTEPFNAYWYEKQTGNKVTNCGEERVDPDYPWLTCTLDGLVGGGVWEAKHVSAFAKPEDIVKRYTPQLHHNMRVCRIPNSILSVFYGTLKYEFYEIPYDKEYGKALFAREEYFWECVRDRKAPVNLPELAVPVPHEEMRVVDMEGNNQWAACAGVWLETQAAAKSFNAASKDLKSLVEPDVCLAEGHKIKITRNKAGSLSIKEIK